MSHPILPIGQLLDLQAVRDAVHFPIAPAYAAERLKPGQHIGLSPDGTAVKKSPSECVGIVDPFLKDPVKPGERFYLFVYQQTVTDLRHAWTHPKIPAESPKLEPKPNADAVARLEDFADNIGLSYQELLDAADSFVRGGNYLCEGGRWEGQGMPDTFWDDFQLVTGTEVAGDKRWSFFSCSC